MTSDVGQAFIDHSRQLLTTSYFPRIERAVAGLAPDHIWWRANAESNSIGNLVLHLAGNLRQWIVSGVGGAADVRRRQEEFDARGSISSDDLMGRLRTTVEEADGVLSRLSPAALLEPRVIQGNDVTVFRGIFTAVEHFSMHTGQILLIAKTFKGDLGFFDTSGGRPRPTWLDR